MKPSKKDGLRRQPLAALLMLGLGTGAALAQTPDAGSLLNQQQRQEPRLPRPIGPEELIRAPRPALQAPGGAQVRLEGLRFSGATELLPADWLQALAAESRGRRYDFAGLQALAQRVTDELRARGWMLARAYLPEQDLGRGELEIALLAGRVDVPMAGAVVQVVPGARGLRLRPGSVERMAALRLQERGALREDELERVMLLVNDLPGVSARARLEPGEASDSTRVHIDVEEGPWFGGTLWSDNYGSRDTGTAQLNGQFLLNDLLGGGEQLATQLTVAEGSRLLRAHLRQPLGASGLRANLGASTMRYDIRRGVGATAGMEGRSQTFNAGLSYPLVRSRLLNVYAAADATRKQLADESNAGNIRDKRVSSLAATLSGDRFDNWQGGGLTTWSATATVGSVNLDRNAGDALGDRLGYQTAGSFHKLNIGASRMQRLGGSLSLLASFNGQWAGKNLDSSEKIILGGPNAVRAYSGSEAQGDSGWFGTLELRYDWAGGLPWGALQLQGYVDGGQVQLHQDTRGLPIATATGRNRYGLAGAGLGLTLSKPGRYLVRVGLAQALGDNPGRSVQGLNADGGDGRRRGWVQGLWWF